MKKGYKCPQCGNNKADMLTTISNNKPSISVLMAPQKLLSHQGIQISCSFCGWQAEADIFRAKKSYQHVDLKSRQSGLT